MDRQELRARFNAIKAHYRPHMAEMEQSPDEWVIDPYAWESIRMQMTPIEWALWGDIRAESAVMYPQIPVGPYFVDFGNPGAKVAIECDGKSWHIDKAKDAARDAELQKLGWTVYRITGRDCFTDSREYEDEDGHTVVTPSTARLFIKSVCDRHPIRRQSTQTSGPRHIGEALVHSLQRWLDRAEQAA